MSDGESAGASAVVVSAAAPSTAADLHGLVELYRSVGWSAYADQPEVLRAAVAGSAHVVVAHRGEQLVGLARVVSDGVSIAYLQDLLVRPDHQRHGVGTSLLVAAFEPFTEVRQQVLLTDDEPRQRAFYASLGFTEAAEHPQGPLRAFLRTSPPLGRESLDP